MQTLTQHFTVHAKTPQINFSWQPPRRMTQELRGEHTTPQAAVSCPSVCLLPAVCKVSVLYHLLSAAC
ncbi:hypothetical protein E2C01_060769 [Portunus trituberculatus]|uniref:Uncharacterized protein n=1 Tax=Portunus trituberculatus TaxID=210409 RepID=A0A5B7H9Z1_PORTR|nr:hypothetical protein [Portunus trituberculatus]